MSPDHLTATEFLTVAEKSMRNGRDKPAFRELLESLKQFPEEEQRLTFEFLRIAEGLLQRKADPGALIYWGTLWSGSVDEQRSAEYFERLEKVILRYFELLGEMNAVLNSVHPHALPLSSALVAVRKRSRERFTALLDTLRRNCGNPKDDPRAKIVCQVERAIARAERSG